MTPVLKSVTVSNFRSIKGTVTIPLDASVVLIQGQNGVGKTSILSAIEIGLTGHAPSLARIDPEFASHLVHKQADEGRIAVTMDTSNGASKSTEVVVTGSTISVAPLLSPDQAQFYSERCYLAQATLSRLLEIYEYKATRHSDSPLTKFVKDLLGLHQFDALIEGLHVAGDVRRLRTKVPKYWKVRNTIPVLRNNISTIKKDHTRIEREINDVNHRLLNKLENLGIQGTLATPSVDLIKIVENSSDEPDLKRLMDQRRHVIAVRDEWQAVQSPADSTDLDNAERAAALANREVEVWRLSAGRTLRNIFVRIGGFIPNLPAPESVGPARACAVTLQALSKEIDRYTTMLARYSEQKAKITALGPKYRQG